jgi:hypothetical protein
MPVYRPEIVSSHTSALPAGERRLVFALIVVTLLIQFALVSIALPLGELLSQKPLFHIDAAWHWYHIKIAEELFQSGRIVGYDPAFNAGFPEGVTYNWSAKLPAAMAISFGRWFSEIVIYKLYVFASAIVAPACVPLALFFLRLKRGALLMGTLFGILLWWISTFHWYHTAGMVSFVAGSYVALPYLAWVLKYLEEGGGLRSLVVIGLIGAFAMFWHPMFPIPVAIGIAIYLAIDMRSLVRERLLKLFTVVPLLALLPNLFWLYPMVHFQKIFVPGIPDISPYGKVVAVSNLWKELAGVWSGNAHGSKLYAPIALAALWGWFYSRSSWTARVGRTFALSGVILNVLAQTGGAIPFLRFIQPNRFAPVGYLALCVPASLGIYTALRSSRESSQKWVVWAARASLAVVGLVTLYSVNEVRQEVSWTHIGHYGAPPPEVRELGPLSNWVLDWLKNDTNEDGRVMFETSEARIHDGAHMAGYYAHQAGREFIGGPYPFANFAGFWDATAFGKPIEQIPQTTFSRYLDLYNVGWFLVHSSSAKHYLDNMPGVVPLSSYGVLKAYRCERSLSYFLAGSGRVTEQHTNNLVLSELSGSDVVIKFHYVRGIKSDPPATILPIQMMDDPNPFIRILNPPKEIRLHM